MSLAAGTRLGPYEVLSPLGAGGMGEVYRARHRKLERDVALKVLPEEVAEDPERRRRFEREARTASALNHPNIVTIHDIDEEAGVHYIAMELVEGQTLREVIGESALPLPRLLALGRQVAEGLARAHAAGIVHRDLKPENVMVTTDGLVKILDFGLAKLARPETAADSALTTVEQGTRAGMVLGTVPYMSPEQASGRPVDFRSDQFSLGSILYEMATGRRAFRKDTTPQTLAAIIEGAPEPLARLNRRLPARLVALVERCLAKDPGKRYESTADLVAALREVPEVGARPRLVRAGAWLAAAGLLVLGGALLPHARHWLGVPAEPASVASPIRSVAVLPLRNLSGDPEQEYFADGMTEALITDLARIGSLKVISRSSAMRYKGTTEPLRDVARALGVDAIVEGSAQHVGDRVRIMTELIDPDTGRVLWGESYDRALTDVLRLEGEVARAIAGGIGTAVAPDVRRQLASRPAVAPDALEAYLKGVFHLQRVTPPDLETARQLFEKAREIDPEYAAAWVGLAGVWSTRMQAGLVPSREAGPRGLAAVEKALALDPDLSEAHRALAILRTWYEWDWKQGASEFERALALNSSNTTAHAFYAHLLTLTGRFDEGAEHMQQALRLDPLNPFLQALAAVRLIFAGRFDEAITRLRTTFEETPGFGFGHIPLWSALDHEGRRDEAVTVLEDFYTRELGAPEVAQVLRRGYATGGYAVALVEAARALEARSPFGSTKMVNIANLYDKAGRPGEAIEWLDKAYEARDPNLAYVGVIPFSDRLRSDPRFQALLRRMDLPASIQSRPAGG